MPKNLKLGDVSGEFHKITKKQTETIIRQFESVKKRLQRQLSGLGDTTSDKLQRLQLEDAINGLNTDIKEVYQHFEGELDDSIKEMAEAVVQNEAEFMEQFGIKLNTSFTRIPTDVLVEIRSGKIYNEKWYL